jgi:CDP-glucose 4,6-dehydratase
VIGGGDWSEDRLIPDLVKSIGAKRPLVIRSAQATRPWQHVLECLAGYLVLGEKLLAVGAQYAEPWNFGPGSEDNRTVAEILHGLHAHWPDLAWKETAEQQPHESTLLYLDNAKARARLGWRPVWPLERALQATAEWYQFFYGRGDVASRAQLTAYTDDARKMKLSWAQP